jgi:DNA-binding transcriptional MerR regulator
MDDELYIDPEGLPCMTVRQAARHTGRNIQTIYSWERRGLLKVRMTDDNGRKVYLMQDVAEVEHRLRGHTVRILDRKAA